MTIEQLQNIHHSNPFKPFTIYLADGRQVYVAHPDFLSHSPSGRTIIVHHEGDSFNILDLLLITEIKVGNGRALRKPIKRRA